MSPFRKESLQSLLDLGKNNAASLSSLSFPWQPLPTSTPCHASQTPSTSSSVEIDILTVSKELEEKPCNADSAEAMDVDDRGPVNLDSDSDHEDKCLELAERRKIDTVLQDLESPSKDDDSSWSEDELDITADSPSTAAMQGNKEEEDASSPVCEAVMSAASHAPATVSARDVSDSNAGSCSSSDEEPLDNIDLNKTNANVIKVSIKSLIEEANSAANRRKSSLLELSGALPVLTAYVKSAGDQGPLERSADPDVPSIVSDGKELQEEEAPAGSSTDIMEIDEAFTSSASSVPGKLERVEVSNTYPEFLGETSDERRKSGVKGEAECKHNVFIRNENDPLKRNDVNSSANVSKTNASEIRRSRAGSRVATGEQILEVGDSVLPTSIKSESDLKVEGEAEASNTISEVCSAESSVVLDALETKFAFATANLPAVLITETASADDTEPKVAAMFALEGTATCEANPVGIKQLISSPPHTVMEDSNDPAITRQECEAINVLVDTPAATHSEELMAGHKEGESSLSLGEDTGHSAIVEPKGDLLILRKDTESLESCGSEVINTEIDSSKVKTEFKLVSEFSEIGRAKNNSNGTKTEPEMGNLSLDIENCKRNSKRSKDEAEIDNSSNESTNTDSCCKKAKCEPASDHSSPGVFVADDSNISSKSDVMKYFEENSTTNKSPGSMPGKSASKSIDEHTALGIRSKETVSDKKMESQTVMLKGDQICSGKALTLTSLVTSKISDTSAAVKADLTQSTSSPEQPISGAGEAANIKEVALGSSRSVTADEMVQEDAPKSSVLETEEAGFAKEDAFESSVLVTEQADIVKEGASQASLLVTEEQDSIRDDTSDPSILVTREEDTIKEGAPGSSLTVTGDRDIIKENASKSSLSVAGGDIIKENASKSSLSVAGGDIIKENASKSSLSVARGDIIKENASKSSLSVAGGDIIKENASKSSLSVAGGDIIKENASKSSLSVAGGDIIKENASKSSLSVAGGDIIKENASKSSLSVAGEDIIKENASKSSLSVAGGDIIKENASKSSLSVAGGDIIKENASKSSLSVAGGDIIKKNASKSSLSVAGGDIIKENASKSSLSVAGGDIIKENASKSSLSVAGGDIIKENASKSSLSVAGGDIIKENASKSSLSVAGGDIIKENASKSSLSVAGGDIIKENASKSSLSVAGGDIIKAGASDPPFTVTGMTDTAERALKFSVPDNVDTDCVEEGALESSFSESSELDCTKEDDPEHSLTVAGHEDMQTEVVVSREMDVDAALKTSEEGKSQVNVIDEGSSIEQAGNCVSACYERHGRGTEAAPPEVPLQEEGEEEVMDVSLTKAECWERAAAALETITHLQQLTLSGCEEGLLDRLLPHCRNLTSLHVTGLGCVSSDTLVRFDPSYLLQVNNLEDLQLVGHFTFTANFNFIKLRKLKKLGLCGAQLPRWPYLGTDITHLYLSPVTRFTSDTWINVAAMKGLQELSLSQFPPHASDSSWQPALSQLPSLRQLALTDCLLGPRIAFALKKLHRLETVVLKPLGASNVCGLSEQLSRVRQAAFMLPGVSLQLVCDATQLVPSTAVAPPITWSSAEEGEAEPTQGLMVTATTGTVGGVKADKDVSGSNKTFVPLGDVARYFTCRRTSGARQHFSFRVLEHRESLLFPRDFS